MSASEDSKSIENDTATASRREFSKMALGGAAALAFAGAEIFARRLTFTVFGFLIFTAIGRQDVKDETGRRKENYLRLSRARVSR